MPIAGKTTETYTPGNYIAGSTPLIATESGTLVSGQNLTDRAVLGRIDASKKLTLCNPGASDGSQTPVGILVHATNASSGDKTIQFYKAGCFFADALVWHAGFDSAAKKLAAFDRAAISIR